MILLSNLDNFITLCFSAGKILLNCWVELIIASCKAGIRDVCGKQIRIPLALSNLFLIGF